MEILSILNINVIDHMWKVGNSFFFFKKKRIMCFLKIEIKEQKNIQSWIQKVRRDVSLYNLLKVNF